MMLKTTTILKRQLNPLMCFTRHVCQPLNFTHFLQNLPNTMYTKLFNGVTVATEERECCNACVGLFIDAGSRYESKTENGIAHFFEHLAFKSTVARSKKALEAQIECLGANYKCFTTRELIVYYVECLCQDVPLATDILIDCVFNNALCFADIEYQKTIVYSEMLEHDNDAGKVVVDYLHSAAFQGTPLAQTVMGPTTNLYNFNRSTISTFLAKCFDPCRTVLAAVGGVKHETIATLGNTYLCHLSPIKFLNVEAYRYTGSEVRYRDDSMPLAHIVIAVEGPSFTDNDRIVMEVAKIILGGWDRTQPGGSAHPTRVAREASIGNFCDAYQAFNINYKDCGLFGVHFLSNVMKQDDMLLLVQNEFMYLSICVTDSEVERAKRFLKTKILSETESSVGACMDIGKWTLYNGCRPSLQQQLNAVDHVTADHVHAACYRYLYDKCPVVAAVGPLEGLMAYGRTRSSMWWLRY